MDARELTEELNLKTHVALGRLVGDYERGLLSRAQVRTGVRAIFDSVGGLVSSETFNLITEVDSAFKQHSTAVELRSIKTPNGVKSVAWTVGTDAVYGFDGLNPIHRPTYNDPDAAAKGKAEFDKQVAALRKSVDGGGW